MSTIDTRIEIYDVIDQLRGASETLSNIAEALVQEERQRNAKVGTPSSLHAALRDIVAAHDNGTSLDMVGAVNYARVVLQWHLLTDCKKCAHQDRGYCLLGAPNHCIHRAEDFFTEKAALKNVEDK